MIFSLAHLHVLAGIVLGVVAVLTAADRHHPRRAGTALFRGFYALVFLVGDRPPPAWIGGGVIAMAPLAGTHRVAPGRHAQPSVDECVARARRLGHWLFLPTLAIPGIAIVGSLLGKHVQVGGLALLDPGNATLAAVGMASVAALILARALTRETPVQGVREARRLVDAMDLRFVAVAVYVLGMALFTVIMGNGFAAFPVMTGGIGVPVLVGVFHANPAAMAAIGMFSGYCGTLMTPMAANFNIVPAALLELPDKNAVIRAQWPTALPVLVINVFLLYFLLPKP